MKKYNYKYKVKILPPKPQVFLFLLFSIYFIFVSIYCYGTPNTKNIIKINARINSVELESVKRESGVVFRSYDGKTFYCRTTDMEGANKLYEKLNNYSYGYTLEIRYINTSNFDITSSFTTKLCNDVVSVKYNNEELYSENNFLNITKNNQIGRLVLGIMCLLVCLIDFFASATVKKVKKKRKKKKENQSQ